MKNMHGGDEPLWREFGRIQRFVERGSRHGRIESLAAEEALGGIAEEVVDQCPGSLRRRFDSLLLNRSSKYRRRVAIDREIAAAVRAETGGLSKTDPSQGEVVDTLSARAGRVARRESPALAHFVGHYALRATNETEDPALACARQEEITLIRARLTPEDWALLWEKLALERSYEDLAGKWREPVGTLKARVARLRIRLRADRASMTLAV